MELLPKKVPTGTGGAGNGRVFGVEWTGEEDASLLSAVETYGKTKNDFRAISTLVFKGTRTMQQIRCRWYRLRAGREEEAKVRFSSPTSSLPQMCGRVGCMRIRKNHICHFKDAPFKTQQQKAADRATLRAQLSLHAAILDAVAGQEKEVQK